MAKDPALAEDLIEPADQPSFKVIAGTKIPVSKSLGSLWKSRRDTAIKKRKNAKLDEAWKQALAYFKNDQLSHRSDGADGTFKGNGLAEQVDRSFSETENIVFANTTTLAPLLYARNPDCQVDANNPEMEKLAEASELLIKALLSKKEAPGINLKPKAQRAAITAQLTNLSWAEVGWTEKADSLEQHYADVLRIAEIYSKKDATTEEIERAEGELLALEQVSDILSPGGPFVKIHPPGNVLRDPMSMEEDLSDCNWIMVCEEIQTTALIAMFYKRDNEKDRDISLYDPTGILADGTNELEDLYTYTPFKHEQTFKEAGFSSQEEYDSRKTTKVWKVWDKTTRRVLMYHDKHWTFPIWVWDDPLKLTTFFPFVPLSLYQSPEGPESKGEVTYYLDQQDAINFYNSTKNAALSWLATKFAYDNTKTDKTDAEKLIRAKGITMTPVKVPEGSQLRDVMPVGIEHPALRYLQLFDKAPLFDAIGRISAVNSVMLGGQFKTNTTNDAVNTYSNFASIRIDNAKDKMEEFVSNICYLLLQLCWMKMDQPTVAALIGNEAAANWMTLDTDTIRTFSVSIIGGTTQKPTSEVRKRTAIEVAQIIGQFASATPMAAVVALKVLERGIEEVVINDQDWKLIMDSILQALQPQGDPAAAAAGPSASNPLEEVYNELVAQGVPPEVARAKAPEVAQKVLQNGNPSSKPN